MTDNETFQRGNYTALIHRDGHRVFTDIYLTGSTESVKSWNGIHMKAARLWALRHLADLATK